MLATNEVILRDCQGLCSIYKFGRDDPTIQQPWARFEANIARRHVFQQRCVSPLLTPLSSIPLRFQLPTTPFEPFADQIIDRTIDGTSHLPYLTLYPTSPGSPSTNRERVLLETHLCCLPIIRINHVVTLAVNLWGDLVQVEEKSELSSVAGFPIAQEPSTQEKARRPQGWIRIHMHTHKKRDIEEIQKDVKMWRLESWWVPSSGLIEYDVNRLFCILQERQLLLLHVFGVIPRSGRIENQAEKERGTILFGNAPLVLRGAIKTGASIHCQHIHTSSHSRTARK